MWHIPLTCESRKFCRSERFGFATDTAAHIASNMGDAAGGKGKDASDEKMLSFTWKRCIPMFCFYVLCLGGGLQADSNPPAATSSSRQVADIDKQIQELEERRQALKERRDFADRQADRLMTLDWFGYREAISREEYWDQQIQLVDQQIAELKKQKQAMAQ